MSKSSVAIIGASDQRDKFGNKAVRAYLRQGFTVYPVNPKESRIEGLPSFRSILDIPGPVDHASFYVPPDVGLKVIAEMAKKGVREVCLNPGSESPELIEKARRLGIEPIVTCGILASPGGFSDPSPVSLVFDRGTEGSYI
ncbi:MAG TPA: CoA-binding protein [Nitrospiria bacterium]|jgi:predicted CoA-binding protein|nr:CoA-binding protein [Nitrospiria bacterium]